AGSSRLLTVCVPELAHQDRRTFPGDSPTLNPDGRRCTLLHEMCGIACSLPARILPGRGEPRSWIRVFRAAVSYELVVARSPCSFCACRHPRITQKSGAD